MVNGIAIMGLNGCGKSTLTHEICKKLSYYEMDVEDYYFPEQSQSRQAILECQSDVTCKYLGDLPYSVPRPKKEVQEMLRNHIKEHPKFVISGVTMNWEEDILAAIDVAFILDAPTALRVKRVQNREEIRFGSRVMPGGDMYEQQKDFRRMIADRDSLAIEESANRLKCPKIRLDGTKSIDESIVIIINTIAEIETASDAHKQSDVGANIPELENMLKN